MRIAFDVGRHAIRAAIDDFDAGLEVSGGLADDIRKHFDVAETGEVLAKVVRCSLTSHFQGNMKSMDGAEKVVRPRSKSFPKRRNKPP